MQKKLITARRKYVDCWGACLDGWCSRGSTKAVALGFKKMDGEANTALREYIFHEVS